MSKIEKQEQSWISAVIDNEASDLEMLRSGHLISQNAEFRSRLVRYQLISDSLRGEDINIGCMDLVSSVSTRLENEPTILAPRESKRLLPKWVQPAAGVALAASVAAVGIMIGPQLINGSQSPTPINGGLKVVANPGEEAMIAPTMVAQKEKHWKTLKQVPNSQLDRYLEQHSQYAVAPGGVQGVMPYTSFVSYSPTLK